MKKSLLAFSLFCASLWSSAQPGAFDASFNPSGTAIGTESGSIIKISSMAVQSNNKILIGGYFFSYNGNDNKKYFTRLNADGTLDNSFNASGSGANSEVSAIVLQPDGKILIGGRFSAYNGVLCGGIARLNADGTLDNNFNLGSGANSTVETIALQADGKILIGGWFSSFNGVTCNSLARLNADGSLDASFNIGSAVTGYQMTPIVFSIAVQSTGKILIGGQFTHYNGVARNHIARLNADGTLDGSFAMGTGMFGTLEDIVVKPNDQILLGGYFWSYNNVDRSRIALLSADGVVDPSFGGDWSAGADQKVNDIALQSDGKILIGGQFAKYNNTASRGVARLNADGTIDNTFNVGTGTNTIVEALAIQSNGNILIGGNFTTYNGVTANNIARLFASHPSVTTGGIALSSYCTGGTVDVPFTITGGLTAGNVFTAELSDATGSFTTPLAIGTLTATTSGTIKATIPVTVAAGTKYRIRVVSSTPALTAPDNGYDLTVVATPATPTLAASGTTTFCQGSSVTFTSSATTDNQWYKDGVAIDNAILQSFEATNGGTYTVTTTTNSCTSAPSAGTVVTVKEMPEARSTANGQPVFCQGGSVTFTSAATAGNQWYKDGEAIANANSQDLTVTQSGTYYVKVTQNGCESIETSGHIITVNAIPATPVITAATATTFCQGNSVVLSSSATEGNRWYKDGEAINGSTAQSLTATQSGSYTVTATVNACTSAASAASAVSVTSLPVKPAITQNGNTLNSSAATGNQWYLNGEALAGATGQQYQVLGGGTYRVQTTQNNCSTMSDAHNFVATAIVSPTTWNGEVYTYPNPMVKTLYIKNTANRKLSLQLVDAVGKVVYRVKVTTATATIDVSAFAGGVYRLLITDSNQLQTINVNLVKQ